MPFAWARKNNVSNDLSWTNDLRFFNSNGIEINVNSFDIPPKIVLHDELGNTINSTVAEYPEQCLSNAFIDASATVLELGARYGSVSCVINKKLNEKRNQVSVEPDSSVWSALEKNILDNECSVKIYKGFVSRTTRGLIPLGYAATSFQSDDSTIPSITVEELETQYNLKFDTLVADCEGFLETFFDENSHLYQQLNTVIFEADFPNKCNYNKIRTELKRYGFREIIYGFQNVYKK
jgi:FkbM family methyltransferase